VSVSSHLRERAKKVGGNGSWSGRVAFSSRAGGGLKKHQAGQGGQTGEGEELFPDRQGRSKFTKKEGRWVLINSHGEA